MNATKLDQLTAYLRSARTLTQAEVDQRSAERCTQDQPATVRWTAVQAHHTASPAGH